MKNVRIFTIALVIMVLGVGSLAAQTSAATSLKGMSFSGSTGLYSIPSGRVAWERTADVGLDIGYHLITGDSQTTHVPKVALTLFKFLEMNFAADMQPAPPNDADSNSNAIIGIKFQFPQSTRAAVALGFNYQAHGVGADDRSDRYDDAGQLYVAVTYPGKFFDWPAETTVVLGYTFYENHTNRGIDYGMGFDLVLLPSVFSNMVHWILDFSNFTYVNWPPYYALNSNRGYLNTGLRFNFASIIRQPKFKFALDILMTDAFDENRGFSFGGVFGVGLK